MFARLTELCKICILIPMVPFSSSVSQVIKEIHHEFTLCVRHETIKYTVLKRPIIFRSFDRLVNDH